MGFENFLVHENMVQRYIVPFYFASSGQGTEKCRENEMYEVICRAFDADARWSVEQKGKAERDTYEYIQDSVFDFSGDKNIGRSWLYQFGSENLQFRYAADSESEFSDWEISTMGVYVFRTNVGFLWYEVSAGEAVSAEELISFQNRFKELHHGGKELQRCLGEDRYETLKMGKWIADILGKISTDIHYVSRRWSRVKQAPGSTEAEMLSADPAKQLRREVPDKALIFNYVLICSENEQEISWRQLGRLAYLLSHGYTSKYHMAEGNLTEMLEPFGDVCWYASKDGCGYYALRKPDNKKFFEGNLVSKIRVDYFLIYILALHQSYSLLNYLRRISSELSANPEEYMKTSQSGELLDELVAEVNTFLMKGMHLSVSHVAHQNTFFEYLQKSLRIKEDIESINLGTTALVKLQRIRKEKEEELKEKELAALREEERRREEEKEREAERKKEEEQEREAQSDRQLNFSLAILSIFAIFSAFLDCGELLETVRTALCDDTGIFSLGSWKELLQYLQENWLWLGANVLLYGLVIVLSVWCVVKVIKSLRFLKTKK